MLTGVLLLAVVAHGLDWGQIGAELGKIGFAIIWVLALRAVSVSYMARAWFWALDRKRSSASFRQVLVAYWYAYAINELTPVRSLGDLLAGWQLKRAGQVESDDLACSLVVQNFLAAAVAALFALAGPLACLAMGNTSDLTLWMLAAALVLFVPLTLVVLLIRFRWAGGLARRLVSISWLRIKNQAAAIEWVDRVSQSLFEFFRPGQRRFHKAILCWLAARALQVCEVWVLLFFLLADQSGSTLLIYALVLQSASLLITGFLAFIPGQIGLAESGASLVAGLLGLHPLTGFTLELSRRVCRLICTGLGLVCGYRLGRES